MDAAAHAYMTMVATRMPAGTLSEVLNELSPEHRQALLDAADRETARIESSK